VRKLIAYGFTVAAIDASGHGDRPRNLQDQHSVPEYERDSSARSFARHLGRATDTASD